MSLPHYAVLGTPVTHSLSPRIHAAFGREFGITTPYLKLDTAQGFADTLARFQAAGGLGCNVTAPDKRQAAALCQTLTPRAQRSGVANTLSWRDGAWHGDNTDGAGLLRDLKNRRGLGLFRSRVLMLGAGGAARAVAPALLDADIAQLVVANRTRANAWDVVDALAAPDRAVACALEELAGMGAFDLVINAIAHPESDATPAYPATVLNAGASAIDMNYGPRALAFLTWARNAGAAHVADGLGMLVEQAAESFALWHGQRPQTDAVYAQLRMASQLG